MIKFNAFSLKQMKPMNTVPVLTEAITIDQFEHDHAAGSSHAMETQLSDPCPTCNGPMRVGDWVCWGFCFKCVDTAMQAG